MRLVKTYGRTAKAAAALIASIEQRGAVSTARVEPVVRRILADVRKNGDRALRKYAAKFDGLAPPLQKVLLESALQAARLQREMDTKDEARIIADLRSKGMQVLESYDAAPFRKLVEGETRKAFVEKNGGELLAAIDAVA